LLVNLDSKRENRKRIERHLSDEYKRRPIVETLLMRSSFVRLRIPELAEKEKLLYFTNLLLLGGRMATLQEEISSLVSDIESLIQQMKREGTKDEIAQDLFLLKELLHLIGVNARSQIPEYLVNSTDKLTREIERAKPKDKRIKEIVDQAKTVVNESRKYVRKVSVSWAKKEERRFAVSLLNYYIDKASEWYSQEFLAR